MVNNQLQSSDPAKRGKTVAPKYFSIFSMDQDE